jgi:hypothetical protein
MMDHAKFLFGLLLAMVFVVAWSFVGSDGSFEEGKPLGLHAGFDQGLVGKHAEMNRSSVGVRQDGGGTLWLGEAWGAIQIVLFVALLSFGMRRSREQRLAHLLGGIAYLGIFLAMCLAYRASIGGAVDGDPKLFLGLPVATAWMIYGLGGIPLFFAFLYVVNFDRWVLTPEDHQTFRDAVELARRAPQEKTTGSGDGIKRVDPT